MDFWIKLIWKILNGKDYQNKIIKNGLKMLFNLLQPYTERCEGSILEFKQLWKYNDYVQKYVKKINLRVINGKGYV